MKIQISQLFAGYSESYISASTTEIPLHKVVSKSVKIMLFVANIYDYIKRILHQLSLKKVYCILKSNILQMILTT